MSFLQKLSQRIRGPNCHLAAEDKQWIEERFLWLSEQFGPAPARRPPLEPTSGLLPRTWDGSDEAGADLLNRLCFR